MQDPDLSHAPCVVISVQAAESRVNMCGHGLLASTLSPYTSNVIDMYKALWLQIVDIGVIGQFQFTMMGITVDDILCSCKDGLSPASVQVYTPTSALDAASIFTAVGSAYRYSELGSSITGEYGFAPWCSIKGLPCRRRRSTFYMRLYGWLVVTWKLGH